MKTGRTSILIGAMPRRRKFARRLGGLVICAGLGGLAFAHFTKQNFPTLDCERHEIMVGNHQIIGVEDMAFDKVKNTIYLSAYDRRISSAGGIYRFSSPDFSDLKKLEISGLPLTPHGFDLTRRGSQLSLAVIDRDLSSKREIAAQLRLFKWSDETPEISEVDLDTGNAVLCNANDLISGRESETFFITSDHSSCTYRGRKFENIFNPNRASVLFLDVNRDPVAETRFEELYFANGIANAFRSKSEVIIAETRKKRLSISGAHIELPGGPDNITAYEDANGPVLWVALHPNLMSFGAYRAGWKSKSPSRAARVDIDGNIDAYDISAEVISGATTALQVGDRLYLAGAFDAAIASCKLPSSLS